MSIERAEVLELLFDYTRKHMGTQATPCIYQFQFSELVEEIEEIYKKQRDVDTRNN